MNFVSLIYLKLKKVMRTPVLIDMRNIYEPSIVKKLGFSYSGIGRA